MKTLSGILILVFALYFVGCATQEGNGSNSATQSTSGNGGGNGDDIGPDVADSEIVWGPHKS